MIVPIIVVSPTSVIDQRIRQWLSDTGQPVVHLVKPREQIWPEDHPEHNRVENIARARTEALHLALREYPNVHHFFFLDDDVLPPEGAIWRLLARNAPAVGGWIPARFGGYIGGLMNEARCFEAFEEVKPGLSKTSLLCLGCTLVARNLLEGHIFSPGNQELVVTSTGRVCLLADSGAFSNYLLNKGVQPLLDSNVVCEHLSVGVPYNY